MTATLPLTVALPLVGEPRDLVAEVHRLTATWPHDVDGRLLVVAGSPSTRERTLLAAVTDVVELRVFDVERRYGALAVAAVVHEGGPLLLAGPGLTAEDLRTASRPSAPRWAERWTLLSPQDVGASVLTAAHDLPSLAALAQQLLEGSGPRLSSQARRVLSAALIVKDEQGSLPARAASTRGRRLVAELARAGGPVAADRGAEVRGARLPTAAPPAIRSAY